MARRCVAIDRLQSCMHYLAGSMDEVDVKYDRRSVLVQGISYDVQEKQFEEAFSEVGPVRKCFLLREKGHKQHKGSGIVQFALPEDAARAVQEYTGKALLGRRVEVVPATKRAPLAARKQRREDRLGVVEELAEPAQKKAKHTKLRALEDQQQALRTVALGNLTQANRASALKLASSIGELESIVDVVPEEDVRTAKLRQDGCGGSPALITYKSIKAAVDAVTKLHGASVSSNAQAEETDAPNGCLWARQLKGEGAMVKKWRVILRNLPFNVGEQDLKKALSPAGFVWQLTIPRKENGNSKGFAFAAFTSRAHTERAIKAVNGKSLRGRVVAVDWAVPKSTFQTGEDNAASMAEAASDGDQHDDSGTEENVEPGSSQQGLSEKELMRSVAEHFAAPEAKPRQRDLGRQGELHARPSKETAERQQSALSAEPGPSSQATSRQAPSQAVRNTAIGRTVFVRGLLSDSTKQQLQARVESFGAVQACRLVLNPTTKQPKGTAFVEFEQASSAQKVAQASAKGRSGEGPGVHLGGRPLEIDIAVTQDDARTMATSKAAAGDSKDKRNLYLAKEGAIEEGSSAWNDMSKGDQERRQRAAKEKATKLRSPNFFLSPTRLSLRNLPYSLEEKGLKSLLIAAVKERASKAAPKLKQVKVLRDATKTNASGDPQSKGIAFAEFSDHEHAVCALRQLNNNPMPFGRDRRPIVEFAVENALTMKKREKREAGKKGVAPERKRKQEVEQGTAADAAMTEDGKQEQNPKRKQGKRQGTATKAGSITENPRASAAIQEPRKLQEVAQVSKDTGRQRAKPQRELGHDSNVPLKKQLAKDARRGTVPARQHEEAGQKGGQQGSGHQVGREKKDALDGLVAKYKASLFGHNEAKGTAVPRKSSLKRWFE